METILITGGTGMVGKALTTHLLEQGYRVIILTRNKTKASASIAASSTLKYSYWDPSLNQIDPAILQIADHIINLAGAGVADKRWSVSRKKEIRDSRVWAGNCIVHALQQLPHHVKTVVNASAIGWYGPDTEKNLPFTEEAPAYYDFLGSTCKDWENSTATLDKLGIRVVTFRIGIVLTPEGGALREFIKPLNWGVATILGNGNQKISWVHLEDLVLLFAYAIQSTELKGIYNAVSPAPVTNQELILTLAKLRRRYFIPIRVPAFLLQVVMGEMSVEVLKSTTVSAQKIMDTGFRFRYPLIQSALASFT